MTTETDRDPLESLLDATAPSVPEPSEALRAEGLAMLVAAEHGDDGRQRTGRRHLSRAAVTGITVGSLLGFGGIAAAAATFEQWSPWAQDPDAALTYTLPSGAECEYRIGHLTGDAEAAQEARDWAGSVDLLAVADIDGTIQMFREDTRVKVLEDGTEIPAAYGTDHYYTPDAEYHYAVTHAVGAAIDAELIRQGFDTGAASLNLMGAAICPGAQW